MADPARAEPHAPLVWTNVLMFVLTLAVGGHRWFPGTGCSHGFTAAAWVVVRHLPGRQRHGHHGRLSPAVGAPDLRGALERAAAVHGVRHHGAAEQRVRLGERPPHPSPARR